MTKEESVRWWRHFSEKECRGYSPLYESICSAVAEDDATLERLLQLPRHTQQPNMLLAAVHDLVLRGGAPVLADCYARGDAEEVGRLFLDVAREAWDDLVPVLLARRTQTNEIGRVALLAPALATLELGAPPTLIDVGTSAGLTLTMDHCRIDYGEMGAIGPPDSPVRVDCEILHGKPPLRATPVARRIGFDRRPLDPADPDDARWLLACTWPDTGRLERTRAALALAAEHPSELHSGDAVADLPALLDEIDGPLVITTTWALAYLSAERRQEFADVLAAASRHRPVFWISGEGPGVVDGLPDVDPPERPGVTASLLAAIRFDAGERRTSRLLAHVHPHGNWLWWYAT